MRTGVLVGLLLITAGMPVTTALAAPLDECLQRAVREADDFLSIGDLKEICARSPDAFGDNELSDSLPPDDAALKRRQRLEQAVQSNPFAITPHAPNYLLPITYMGRRNPEPLGLRKSELDNIELKLQISYKMLMGRSMIFGHGDLYFAYTNTSWWQAYNGARSRPFRETNHEPELFLAFDHPWRLFGMDYAHTHVGLNHESNGREGLQSRSWNRVFANFLMQRGRFYLSIKPWWRIEEDRKETPDDPDGDDNPDITDFTGYGEVRLFYKWSRSTLSVMLRNNFKSKNRGAIELGYSFPLTARARGYVQVFQGYSESLIDYDHETSRIGVGIQLNEWL